MTSSSCSVVERMKPEPEETIQRIQMRRRKPATLPRTMPATAPGAGPAFRPWYWVGMARTPADWRLRREESAEVEDDVVDDDEEERIERTRLRMWWKGCLESRMRLSAGDIEVVEVDVAVVDAGSRRCGRTGMAGGRAAYSRS